MSSIPESNNPSSTEVEGESAFVSCSVLRAKERQNQMASHGPTSAVLSNRTASDLTSLNRVKQTADARIGYAAAAVAGYKAVKQAGLESDNAHNRAHEATEAALDAEIELGRLLNSVKKSPSQSAAMKEEDKDRGMKSLSKWLGMSYQRAVTAAKIADADPAFVEEIKVEYRNKDDFVTRTKVYERILAKQKNAGAEPDGGIDSRRPKVVNSKSPSVRNRVAKKRSSSNSAEHAYEPVGLSVNAGEDDADEVEKSIEIRYRNLGNITEDLKYLADHWETRKTAEKQKLIALLCVARKGISDFLTPARTSVLASSHGARVIPFQR